MQLSQQLETLVLDLTRDANSPKALAVAILLRNREYGQLVALTADPAHYLDVGNLFSWLSRARTERKLGLRISPYPHSADAERYFRDAQCTAALKKLQLDIGMDPSRKAHETFHDCERQCARTNVRLEPFLHNEAVAPSEERLYGFLRKVKRKISDVLGPLPPRLDGRFGKGATFGDKGRLATIPDKMTSRPTLTSEVTALLPFWYESFWYRANCSEKPWRSLPQVVKGNRFTTVPKTALTDRGICVEPSLNLWFQLAVGDLLKEKLSAVGLDLKPPRRITWRDKAWEAMLRSSHDDPSYGETELQIRHRSLARQASLDGSLATIDLSNASDTMSKNLVRLLLPRSWYDLLETLRSPSTLIDGKWHHLQKFSSMGNGYTFELETLLFYSIAVTLAGERGESEKVSVYGDDIIVPVECAPDVVAALRWFGFTPNPKKTFLTGRFRESCGGDFFSGVAVRPFYIKEDPSEPQDWIVVANGLRRVGHEDHHSYTRWVRLKRAWYRSLAALPSTIRQLRGPEELGDLVIHDDPANWRTRRNPQSLDIREVKAYVPVTERLSWDHWSPGVVLASALYGVPQEGPLPRDSVSGYRVGWLPFS